MKGLESQLRKITDEIEERVNGEVSLEELLDFGFLDRNSDFETLNEFFKFHAISVNDIKEFEALDVEVLNKAVEQSTCFSSWDDMLEKAGEEHIMKKLKDAGFDIDN